MKIQRINNYQPKTNFQTFKAGTIQTAGMLSRSTVHDVEGIMSAYREIVSKLSCKTEKGLKKIQEEFPNVTIGEGITFHNCGENGTSILIRSAESKKYHNLTRIIERKGRSINYGTKIVINSFILDGNERLLENKDENVAKSYPLERLYLTSEEIKNNNLDVKLKGVLASLDTAMLQFRKYLFLNQNNYLKLPDGRIQYGIADELNKIEDLHKEIDSKLEALPKSVGLAIRKSCPDYRLQTGLRTHSFTNPDGSYVVYTPVESDSEYELKRFVKYDKDGKALDLFMAVDSSKLVSNLNKDYPTYIPNTFKYADEAQIQEQDYLPKFQELTKCYKLKLIGLLKRVDEYLEGCRKVAVKAEFPEKVSSNIKSILDAYVETNNSLKNVSLSESIAIRKAFSEYVLGTKGLTFNNLEEGYSVQVLPVNSKRQSGLTRFTVKKDGNPDLVYLFKDGKHLVSNYNPLYPLTIPSVLKYADDSEIQAMLDETMPYISYFKEKMDAYKTHIDTNVGKFKKSKKSAEQNDGLEDINPEKKEVVRECKKMLSDAIDAGNPENLAIVLQNIKTKVIDFFTRTSERQ